MTGATILGCAGPTLGDDEARFFRGADPWGFILFARNIVSAEQVRALTSALRDSVGRPDAPVLIDQEGGRVARLRPPLWPAYPPGAAYGALYRRDEEAGLTLAWLGGRLIARDLAALGVNVNCAPIVDVPAPGAHDIIGDRAYADAPEPVAALGRAFAEGLIAGGVAPIMKHIPGHGRALADSHLDLPVVDADRASLTASDFAPFRALADMRMAMTAHVVFTAIDRERPVTWSPTAVESVIRGEIGFDGLLITDDLSMNALSGTIADRARRSIAAGCDVVLHCNGDLAEMHDVADAAGSLSTAAAARARRALADIETGPRAFDADEARARFEAALGADLPV
jgi:beta-N-acetylhexosaminidase